jgi:two-component system cell cycle response regulator DivK
VYPPLLEVASSRSRPPKTSAPAAGSRSSVPLAERVVLIVDDYEDTRMLYVEHLQDAGFRVIEAGDGEEAVALALSHRPDAIIMDLSMPKLDGWDATRKIRSDPHMAETYIIALSAMDGEISRSMAFDAGCNDFIAKPFLATALVQVLQIHFRGDDAPAGDVA